MAQPSSGGPDEAESEVARIQAIAENAKKLGLVWGWRPATVVTPTSLDAGLAAKYDGDSNPTDMRSIIGAVSVGERVYGMFVPPGGNFVVGRCLIQPTVRLRITNTPSVPSGGELALNWNVNDQQVPNNAFGVVPVTDIVVPETGVWAITVRTNLGGAGGARNYVAINTTTAIVGAPPYYRASFPSAENIGTVSVSIPLLAGDTFAGAMFQDSGAPVNLSVAWLFATRTGGWPT